MALARLQDAAVGAVELAKLPSWPGAFHGAGDAAAGAFVDEPTDGGFRGREAPGLAVQVARVEDQGAADELIEGERSCASRDGVAIGGEAPAAVERTPVDDDLLAPKEALEANQGGEGVYFVGDGEARRQRGFGYDVVADGPRRDRRAKKRAAPLGCDRDDFNDRDCRFSTSERLNCP